MGGGGSGLSEPGDNGGGGWGWSDNGGRAPGRRRMGRGQRIAGTGCRDRLIHGIPIPGPVFLLSLSFAREVS